ncbi:hypothetical protein [Kitasatospora sp. NPDC050543]|uniref:hypothetical protein n=1 Tax=Kitasatospora sp. NPDC050543 TaxID=3364054 RepID=UPI0037ADE774
MSEVSIEAVAGMDSLAGGMLKDRISEMFVELQRADGKAAALCAVTGGLLAAAGASMSVLADGSRPMVALLLFSSALLVSALVAALYAIRPVLPASRALAGLEGVCAGLGTDDALAALQALSKMDHVRIEACRLSLLAGLADRKFRAIKVSVDLIVTATLVAGIGLLIITVAC